MQCRIIIGKQVFVLSGICQAFRGLGVDLVQVLAPQCHTLAHAAGHIGPREKGSFRNTATFNEQVNAGVQLVEEKVAEKGDVVFALGLGQVGQRGHAWYAAPGTVEEEHA